MDTRTLTTNQILYTLKGSGIEHVNSARLAEDAAGRLSFQAENKSSLFLCAVHCNNRSSISLSSFSQESVRSCRHSWSGQGVLGIAKTLVINLLTALSLLLRLSLHQQFLVCYFCTYHAVTRCSHSPKIHKKLGLQVQ